jgi:hypothetical protein
MYWLGFMRPRDGDRDGLYDREGGTGDVRRWCPIPRRTGATRSDGCWRTSLRLAASLAAAPLRAGRDRETRCATGRHASRRD